MQLNDVLVAEDMVTADRLAVVDAGAPDACGFEVVREVAMNQRRHVDQRAAGRTGEGGRQIGGLAGLLGIDPNDVEEPIDRIAHVFKAGAMSADNT